MCALSALAAAKVWRCGWRVFVVDAQDNFQEALQQLHVTVVTAYKINPRICFEVFVHKVDGLSDHAKIETQRDVQQQVLDDLEDADMANIHVSFFLTNIYDHSIFEAFSKVVQRLIPQLPTLESLLDMLIANSRIEKAFLFDVASKIYVATDSSPVDVQTYELAADMIDVVIDVSCIYGARAPELAAPAAASALQYDQRSLSVFRLSNDMVLDLREVNEHLALVCMIRDEHYAKAGILDFNLAVFCKSCLEVLAAATAS